VIKYFIMNFLFPFPLFFYLALGSAALLWWQKARPARILITTAVAVLMIAGFPPLSDFFVTSLEGKYSPLSDEEISAQGENVRYIVILGGGYCGRTDLPLTSRHSPSQLFRVIEGMRLHRLVPGSRLIVSGGGGVPTEAEGMSDLLQSLGVKKEDLLLEPRSGNTYEEALFVREMVGETPFFLVTSAIHMPRAVALFEKAGLKPVPSPAEYLSTRDKPTRSLLPSLGALRGFEAALYEHLARLKERLLGRI
jgi:uncharacterized SAM-binding protein YcdF (DUF218 family)